MISIVLYLLEWHFTFSKKPTDFLIQSFVAGTVFVCGPGIAIDYIKAAASQEWEIRAIDTMFALSFLHSFSITIWVFVGLPSLIFHFPMVYVYYRARGGLPACLNSLVQLFRFLLSAFYTYIMRIAFCSRSFASADWFEISHEFDNLPLRP